MLALNDDALGKEAEALAILNELADEDKDEGLLQVASDTVPAEAVALAAKLRRKATSRRDGKASEGGEAGFADPQPLAVAGADIGAGAEAVGGEVDCRAG